MDKPPGQTRRKVIEELFAHEIRTVLIGGLAARAHGSPRMTEDLDLAARLVDADRIIETMYALGYRMPTRVSHDGLRASWAITPTQARRHAETMKLGAFHFFLLRGKEILDQIDFVFENPVPFARLHKEAVRIGKKPEILVASLKHLRTMKRTRIARGEAGPADETDLAFIEDELRKKGRK